MIEQSQESRNMQQMDSPRRPDMNKKTMATNMMEADTATVVTPIRSLVRSRPADSIIDGGEDIKMPLIDSGRRFKIHRTEVPGGESVETKEDNDYDTNFAYSLQRSPAWSQDDDDDDDDDDIFGQDGVSHVEATSLLPRIEPFSSSAVFFSTPATKLDDSEDKMAVLETEYDDDNQDDVIFSIGSHGDERQFQQLTSSIFRLDPVHRL